MLFEIRAHLEYRPKREKPVSDLALAKFVDEPRIRADEYDAVRDPKSLSRDLAIGADTQLSDHCLIKRSIFNGRPREPCAKPAIRRNRGREARRPDRRRSHSPKRGAPQIGRAACRERVWSGV